MGYVLNAVWIKVRPDICCQDIMHMLWFLYINKALGMASPGVSGNNNHLLYEFISFLKKTSHNHINLW